MIQISERIYNQCDRCGGTGKKLCGGIYRAIYRLKENQCGSDYAVMEVISQGSAAA